MTFFAIFWEIGSFEGSFATEKPGSADQICIKLELKLHTWVPFLILPEVRVELAELVDHLVAERVLESLVLVPPPPRGPGTLVFVEPFPGHHCYLWLKLVQSDAEQITLYYSKYRIIWHYWRREKVSFKPIVILTADFLYSASRLLWHCWDQRKVSQ